MKTLALAQHLGLEVFEFNGEYYTGGTLKDFNKESGSNYEEIEEVSEDNEPFINWLAENCTKLEDELIQSSYDDSQFEYGSQEYLVCIDSEADEAWDAYMDAYIDDCVLCDLPENYREYFDSEKFKKDCLYDGRGHSLASYDGNENEIALHTEHSIIVYYIYRTK